MIRFFCSSLLLLRASGTSQDSATALLDDSCGDAPVSLVQSRAFDRRAASSQLRSPPWEQGFYFVGAHHKAGSQLLRDVMRHGFDALGAPGSCRWGGSFSDSYITTAPHDDPCQGNPNAPIQWDNNAKIANFLAAKAMAASRGQSIRGAHSVRKPKDMLVSAYCYHHRGKEFGNPIAPWPEIMAMGPEEGMMALWPMMSFTIQDMVNLYTGTTAEEMFHVRFEEIAPSSEGFDRVVQSLFHFLFAPMVSEADLQRSWQAAKVEDLNVDPNFTNAIAEAGHGSDDECLKAGQEAMMRLDPRLVQQLKDWQALLGYSTENWPDPIIG